MNLPCEVHGDPVLEPGCLRLGSHVVTWDGTPVWRPPEPPPARAGAEERLRRLEAPPLDSPERLGDLLGQGPGLTPSGDDVILGLLLARARWGLPVDEDLVHEARRRTTTLSANLIALAAEGSADERLIELVDHVRGGGPTPTAFLDWGAHSGLDVLRGVRLAFERAGRIAAGCEGSGAA